MLSKKKVKSLKRLYLKGKERNLVISKDSRVLSKGKVFSLDENGNIRIKRNGIVKSVSLLVKESPTKGQLVKKSYTFSKKKHEKREKYRVSRFDPYRDLERVFILSDRTVAEIEHYYRLYGLLLGLIRKRYFNFSENDKLSKEQVLALMIPLTEFYKAYIKDRHPGKHNPNCPVIRRIIYTPMKG